MNRLASETSPYLRQHAENPVDWYPWGPEALQRARVEDKPLFVSVGYSACHWCHVMAHESFEDPRTAAALGAFVSVKVDREERPDVDAVYMAAVQAFSGSGGWPMSVFCTPDGRPFFAGTYFPPTDRGGMPSFRRVVASLADIWSSRRDEVEQQADALAEAMAGEARLLDRLGPSPDGPPAFEPALEKVVSDLSARFDAADGGWGPAPKFPRPTYVELCLRHHARTGDPRSLAMATRTLDAMAAGGIYDHLAGGFARYSTDQRWLVPHFEKMLTDQALLARAYLHAWQLTGRADYRQVFTETLDYVLSELRGPGGGLCSSQDADAAGVEGGHATFTAAEAREALEAAGRPDLVGAVLDWYGITEHGNWEGTNVLSRPLGSPLARPPEVEEGRVILLAARRARPGPGRDDKVLTEWNAMTVAVLAEAASAAGDERWATAAQEVAELLFTELRSPAGRWLRSWQEGRARHDAFAGDHAWLIEACTRMAELTGQAVWTRRAAEVATTLLGHFADDDPTGGLFTTADDAEPLVVRPKELLDGALPSANAVAAWALLRLWGLTGDDDYRQAGEDILRAAGPLVTQHAPAVADMVSACALLSEPLEVVVAGDRADLLAAVRARWLPAGVLAWGERTPTAPWEGRVDGHAYVCRSFACRAPASDVEELASQLPASGA